MSYSPRSSARSLCLALVAALSTGGLACESPSSGDTSGGGSATGGGGSDGGSSTGASDTGGSNTGGSATGGQGTGGSGTGGQNTGGSSTGGSSPGKTDYAPYFYTWGWGSDAYPFKDLVDLRAQTAIAGVTLAFVLSDGGCSATQDIQQHQADVDAFVAAGGKLKASFGGAAGTYLENACPDAPSLAAAIGAFVDQTGIHDLDFDVEQWQATTPEINAKRSEALAMVQAQKGVKIAFTLPSIPHDEANGIPGGVPADSLAVVASALSAGVAISHVNLMTMDFYGNYGDKTMAEKSISAVVDCKAQLQTVIPGLTDAEAFAMLGATPMIGVNDDPAEVFSLDDAAALASFAKQNHLGLIAFWAIHRDQPGSGSLGIYSMAQDSVYAFHQALKVVAE